MVGIVRNQVVVLEILLVELEVSVEDVFPNPELSVRSESLTIQFLRDFASVLDRTDHVLHGFPLVPSVGVCTLSQVLLQVEEGGIEIRRVELVRQRETNGSELSALLDNRVQEASSVGQHTPFLVRLDLLKEILVNHCAECAG